MAGIAFSYDPSTAVGRVRLLSGETDPAGLGSAGGDRTRTDSEIEAFIGCCDGDERLAAACLLEAKSAEYAAQAVTITQGTLRHDYRVRSQHLLEAARALRDGAGIAPAIAGASGAAAFVGGSAIDPAEA